MAVTSTYLYDLLTQISTCIQTELTPTPRRTILPPGTEVVWDECCDGQSWVRVISQAPGSAVERRSGNCTPSMWEVTLGIGVIRCAAVPDAMGNPPSAVKLARDTDQMLTDAEAIKQALACCMNSDLSLRFLSWSPKGPQGGCVGGEWTIIIKIGNCGCPEPEVTP